MSDSRDEDLMLIYGGSFDPPHRAHVQLPASAAQRIGASAVVYVPAGQPPHKGGRRIAAADHRLAMLRLALAGREGCSISTFELDREGPSYTVTTLEHLIAELGEGVRLRLLIGADMAAMFYEWRQPRRIIELAEPLVMMRSGFDVESMLAAMPSELNDDERAAWRDRVIETPTIDISSTELRRLLAAGRYDDPLVHQSLEPAVLDYIRQRRLYEQPA